MMGLFSFGFGTKSSSGRGRFLLVAILLTMPVSLLSQAYFGTVTGVLTDPSGAVIPGPR